MGKIIGAVGSLFGGRKRRREQRAANEEYQQARDNFRNFNVRNFGDEAQFTGLSADDARGFDAVTGQAGTLGPAAQAGLATLGPAMGYDSQGYDATGYTAAQTDAGQLLRGEDTGLTNTMRNLQVSTAGAEMAAQEADQALAASQLITASLDFSSITLSKKVSLAVLADIPRFSATASKPLSLGTKVYPNTADKSPIRLALAEPSSNQLRNPGMSCNLYLYPLFTWNTVLFNLNVPVSSIFAANLLSA